MIAAREALEADMSKLRIDQESIARQVVEEAEADMELHLQATLAQVNSEGEQIVRAIWEALEPARRLTHIASAVMPKQG